MFEESEEVIGVEDPICIDEDVIMILDEPIALDELMELILDIWLSEDDMDIPDVLLLPLRTPPGLLPPIGVPVAVKVDVVLGVCEIDEEVMRDDTGDPLLDAELFPDVDMDEVGLSMKVLPLSLLDINIDIWLPELDMIVFGDVDAAP